MDSIVAPGTARFAYAGCYTRNTVGANEAAAPVGISVFAVAADSGALAFLQAVPSENPSFLALDPTQRFLLAVNETDDFAGGGNGSVEAYAIDQATGGITLINREDAGGAGPAHLAVDPAGRHVVVANYAGGTFTVLPIRDDGGLEPVSDTMAPSGSGPNAARQEAPHPHAVVFDPVGGFAVTADLGIDTVRVFRLDPASGRLAQVSEAKLAPGAGPRHLAFTPDGRFLYVINELDATVTVFAFDPAGGQIGAELQTISTLPDDFAGAKSTAEIAVHPSGRFMYGSNRGMPGATSLVADSIVGYRVDQAAGRLSLIGHSTDGIDCPRHFAIDPIGTWLYVCNQHGDSIIQFVIDQATGALSAIGEAVKTPTPVCLVFKHM